MLKIFEDAIGFFYCLECADKEDPRMGAMYVPERENVLEALDELGGEKLPCNWCGADLKDAAIDYLNS